MRYLSYGIWLSVAISFLCIHSIANSTEVNTGNILSNSTFGTGDTTTTTGWSTDGDEGIHTHGAWNGFPYQTGMDDSGGVLAFEGHEEDNVYQDVDLVDDGHLTQSQMNQGFTSTMGADVWFWNNIENTLTLKQTITGADGSVSTQVREITGTSGTTGNKFTNYTNQYIQGSNTQTDITIRAELFNETAGTAYDDSHRGPDVDNVTLDVTYQNVPPINEDAQEAIDNIEDVIDDIPEDFFEEEFTFDDEIIIIDLLPEAVPEEITFEDIESFEEFEEMFIVTEEMEIIEEADIETIEEEEIEVAEMEAEAEPMTEVEEEATIEEAEEPTKEVQNEETMEDTGESMEEEPENEESVSEANADEDETTEEAEPDSEESEDTEVQTAEAGDEEEISTESEKQIEISTDVGGTTVELKKVEKQLSKIDKMLIQPELDSYEEVEFYESKDIYQDANLELFENQVDLGGYSVQIYAGVTLSAYSVNDPMQIFEERMDFLARQKLSIMLELKKLRGN
tara:strand:+ start:425 stop:1954 length:1530 start_codon:yes stop_codon:yes gene_type:complete